MASTRASIGEAVVDDELPESPCVVLIELSADVSVLLIGPPVDVLIGPADDVSDSVDSNLVDVTIVLVDWAGSSEKFELVSGLVLGDEGVDSAVVGLLDPLDPLDPLALDPLDPVDPLVPEVLVSAWMAATAASYFSVSLAITASWVVTTSSAASFAVFTFSFKLSTSSLEQVKSSLVTVFITSTNARAFVGS